MAGSEGRVLVTGAMGYIAAHVVKLLQEAGHEVRGTVRSVQDLQRIKRIYNLTRQGEENRPRLVEADVLNQYCWPKVVKDMDYVIHVASPEFRKLPEFLDDIVNPIVAGTMNVLKACAESGTVKRVVLTSTLATIDGPCRKQDLPSWIKKYPKTEAEWSDKYKLDPYNRGKWEAEWAAWDFVKRLPDGQRFELTVLNPSFVLGPPITKSPSLSITVIQNLLEGRMPVVPNVNFCIADVRDVAVAHVRAMTLPDCAGQRFMLGGESLTYREIAVLLKSVLARQGYRVPTLTSPEFAVRLASKVDETAKALLPWLDTEPPFLDLTKMREVLKIEEREVRDTVVEMAYAMIEGGYVKRTRKYKGPFSDPEERAKYMALVLTPKEEEDE